MPALYSVEMNIAATAYIKAESEEKALEIARSLNGKVLEVADAGSEVEISGLQFSDPDLPDVSLSPAMTVREVSEETAELVTEYEENAA